MAATTTSNTSKGAKGKGAKAKQPKAAAAYAVSVTATAQGGNRMQVLGMPVSTLLRYMGSVGFTAKQAHVALQGLGVPVNLGTCRCQVGAGASGTANCNGRGALPKVTSAQAAAVKALLPKA